MTEVDLQKITDGIAASKAPDNMPVKIVAIDGHGGAGKSTLAKQLAVALKDAEIVRTDDFASWDNPTDWWPEVIKRILEPIQNGAKTLSYQPTSWGPDHHPAKIENQPVKPIMILEGVGSARLELQPYLSYAIWVETPIDICLQRGLERDGQDALPKWQKWIDEEDQYIARDNPKTYANVIVSGI